MWKTKLVKGRYAFAHFLEQNNIKKEDILHIHYIANANTYEIIYQSDKVCLNPEGNDPIPSNMAGTVGEMLDTMEPEEVVRYTGYKLKAVQGVDSMDRYRKRKSDTWPCNRP